MYLIGEFSKLNRITTKTLRHYDEIGLLKPQMVDVFTGYRYYSSRQTEKLFRIINLKEMGLSLTEIKEIIDSPEKTEEYLAKRESEIQKRLEVEKKKLLKVKNYIKHIKGENFMEYNPVIKELPEVICASMRTVIPGYDTFFDIVPKMGDEMRRVGAKCAVPEYCFTIYHDGEYREKDIDVEVCEAVVDFCEDSEMVKYKTIEKVDKALCILHKGPYKTLGEAYGFALNWIEDNGYKIAGKPRESYIDGIWNKDNPDEWLTEIQIPIE